jgi:CP family cyanate transporter-like MFS transporter
VTRTAGRPDSTTPETGGRGLALVGVAIVMTGLNLRTAVGSVGPVLEEIEAGLGLSSAAAGLLTTMPVLCFALLGFAGPPLSARFRDSHVLAGGLLTMAVGLVLRSLADAPALFFAGTVLAMTGGALGNVLLPSLVKRYFPTRTGLLVGAYGVALGLGAAVAAVVPQQVVAATGAEGWRWALGLWAVLAVVSALPWLAVRARPGSSRGTHAAVPMRALLRSRLAWALALFFGVQAMQAYVVIGWSAQYLRDAGLSASTAGWLLGLNTLLTIPINGVVPVLAARQRLQRPVLVTSLVAYVVAWSGLWAAPTAAPVLWMSVLAIGLGSFPLALTLFGLRARTPESTAALSTFAQGLGYLVSGLGPLLVGLTRGATGGYTGMFVIVLAGVVVLGAAGWICTRPRVVEDEIGGAPGGPRATAVVEAAGEVPIVVRPTDVGRDRP